jgi:hypothetical protein
MLILGEETRPALNAFLAARSPALLTLHADSTTNYRVSESPCASVGSRIHVKVEVAVN